MLQLCAMNGSNRAGTANNTCKSAWKKLITIQHAGGSSVCVFVRYVINATQQQHSIFEFAAFSTTVAITLADFTK